MVYEVQNNNQNWRKKEFLNFFFLLSNSFYLSILHYLHKSLKKTRALTVWFGWIEHPPMGLRVAGSIPVRAHAWIAGSIPGRGQAGGSRWMFLSLSFSPLSKISKNILKKKTWAKFTDLKERLWRREESCSAVAQ